VFRQKYSFHTVWAFKASRQKVWQAIDDIENAPCWWPGIRQMRILGGKRRIEIDSQIRARVRGLLGELKFTMTITDIHPFENLHLTCSGDLEGFGHITLCETGDTTWIDYIWEVTTTGWIMNLFGLIFKPLLAASHNRVMDDGYRRIKPVIEGMK
jgi:carbon monoxide dehydrogenase subunit G